MIDLKKLRENPDYFKNAAAQKGVRVDIDALLAIDEQWREAQTELQHLVAEKNKIGKEIGAIAGRMKKADGDEKKALSEQMAALQKRPSEIKTRESELTALSSELEGQRLELWLQVPQPADADVPVGASADENVELSIWCPEWFDVQRSFEANKGFKPRSHMELGEALGLFEFERGVRMAGSRSYVLTGDGMRLAQAALRFGFDTMVNEHGFVPLSVPVVVRDEVMTGTGFFPGGRDQAYEIGEVERGGGQNLYLTGTGEVGLMGYHQGEILEFDSLPLRYVTVSTCFRREAGAAGKDTAGLYRVHQFDKVEQVVLCTADEDESRAWHKKMIGYVERLLKALELPHRLLQCCTGDLGTKNADMIDIESWMPSRGDEDADGTPSGAWGETHSASRLYDYQCRRLNIRYRDPETGKPVVCHSLNNTVLASPRLLIPIIEMYQNDDGSITIPTVLRPYMNGQERIEAKKAAVASS